MSHGRCETVSRIMYNSFSHASATLTQFLLCASLVRRTREEEDQVLICLSQCRVGAEGKVAAYHFDFHSFQLTWRCTKHLIGPVMDVGQGCAGFQGSRRGNTLRYQNAVFTHMCPER